MKAPERSFFEMPGGLVQHRAHSQHVVAVNLRILHIEDATWIMSAILDALNDTEEWEPWQSLTEGMVLPLVQDSMTRTINGVTEYRYRKEEQ